MSETAAYILALLDIPGVGRVAASRLADHFADPAALLACPREQLVLRLKGVAGAADIADEISSTLEDRLSAARRRVEDLAAHEVTPLTPLDAAWPRGLADLERGRRPAILYTHGAVDVLERPGVALFAVPPLSEGAFERSQTALRHVLRARGVPVTGDRTRFDAAVHGVCASDDHNLPSVYVLSSGLSRMHQSLRTQATAAVRCGGLLISPFEMDHGPFEHDDNERAAVQAAISDVCIFIEPGEATPERRAMEWSVAEGRSVFVIGEVEGVPEAHRITSETDFDWLEVAIAVAGGDRK